MASDKDVLGKADALLRRHVVAPPASGSDTGGVPVLTDLIEAPPEPGLDAADTLADEVFTRVMEQVEGRLAVELERRLEAQLVEQAHAAVGNAIAELRADIARAVTDAVAEAFARRPVK